MKMTWRPKDTRQYKAVFRGFYFCLTYPELGARENGNSQVPKDSDKQSPKKNLLFIAKASNIQANHKGTNLGLLSSPWAEGGP